MINHFLKHTIYKFTATKSKYGDIEYSGDGTEIKGWIRENAEVVRSQNAETINCDAMAWFKPDEGLREDDIIKFGDSYYRIKKMIYARRLGSNRINFLKALLQREKGMIS